MQLVDGLEAATQIITILGFPGALFLYFKEKQKERRDREYGTYNALDDKYIEFLKMCIDHAELGVFYKEPIQEASANDKAKLYALFEVLVCLFERAFLMYQGHSDKMRRHQWDGWNAYMEDWMGNPVFREAWHSRLGYQYDSAFLEHMNAIYNKNASE